MGTNLFACRTSGRRAFVPTALLKFLPQLYVSIPKTWMFPKDVLNHTFRGEDEIFQVDLTWKVIEHRVGNGIASQPGLQGRN
jgi:hypothetical protein